MPAALIPDDEDARLAALTEMGILDAKSPVDFAIFPDLASKLFSSPVAAISLIDKNRQWFLSSVGLDDVEHPRDISFCAHAILRPNEILYVPDATMDARFADNPLVVGKFGLRFYAGAPVLGPGGYPVGAICIIDKKPRSFSHEQLTQLKQLACGVAGSLKLHASIGHTQRLARTDPVTGLWNRADFDDRLREALCRGQQNSDSSIGLLMVDLDGFKALNELFGHDAGDATLKEVAHRLRRTIGQDDTLSRLGHDEFCIIVERASSLTDLSALAARIHSALAERFLVEQQAVPLRTCIGIAHCQAASREAHNLLHDADIALHEAKRVGPGSTRIADAGRTSREAVELGALGMREMLRSALLPGQEPFVLALQPIYSLQSRELRGFEALVRWPQPNGTLLSPTDFIPVAEATGMVMQLDRWVLDQACSLAATWPESIQVSSNLSAANFLVGDLVGDVCAILDRHGLAPSRLRLEMTESALLWDPLRAKFIMSELRRLGVKVVLDDFGTGHASFAYLRHYDFDGLKIDSSFTADIETNARNRALVVAIIQMARGLGIEVTAEGVETDGQLRILRRHRVSSVQGYLLGRPMTREDATAMTRHAAIQAARVADTPTQPQARRTSQPKRFVAKATTHIGFCSSSAAKADIGLRQTTLRGVDEAADYLSLVRTEELLQLAVAALPDPFYIKDLKHRFIVANIALASQLGALSVAEVIGKTDADFHEPQLALGFHEHEVTVLCGATIAPVEQEVRKADGTVGWFVSVKAPLIDAGGAVIGLVGHGRDITLQKQTEMMAKAQAEDLSRLADAVTLSKSKAEQMRDVLIEAAAVISDGFALFDPSDSVVLCNEAFGSTFGASCEDLIGQSFEDLLRRPTFRAAVKLADEAYERWIERRVASHLAGAGIPAEYEHGGRWFLILERRTKDGSIVLSRTDITHLKKVEDDLRRLATLDALTEISNRRDFIHRGSRLLERCYHDGKPATLILFDIDHFKRINDTYGHLAGDEVLRQVANICSGLLRPTDLLARWGGEEFVQLIVGMDIASGRHIAERLRRCIAEMTVVVDSMTIRLTASFGLAVGDTMSCSLKELTAQADRALYRAKRAGRNRISVARDAWGGSSPSELQGARQSGSTNGPSPAT